MKTFIAELDDHNAMMARLAGCSEAIEAAARVLIFTLKQGGKILLCGNGGSAADCQHIAAELVVQYQKQRQALAAIALTTDTSILTAHANDFGFDTVYSRQVEAIGNERDCLIAISTSGRSKNILNAAAAARLKGMAVIGLTGGDGGELVGQVTHPVIVPSAVTARIQEAHILIGHWWCGAIEDGIDTEGAQ
ncbi:MAG: SIS domain-containing protein [Methylobacter sp.]|nr:SIS domain-containing protein [Methylobacter sp.]MDP2097298.1 SIS domain-containing protein [Methylobacter sp.]MDP2428360.1 SIS domain-containing protein [Methylobacter sp.]MDP3053203.1 SIS domain-containing protein [Methylobacter sp.]MDP3361145.1 SIS domain-containing protein [Methylobacter sp.]